MCCIIMYTSRIHLLIHVYLYIDLYDHFSNVESKIFNTI